MIIHHHLLLLLLLLLVLLRSNGVVLLAVHVRTRFNSRWSSRCPQLAGRELVDVAHRHLKILNLILREYLLRLVIVYDVDLVAYNKCRMILLSLSQRVTTGSHAILVGWVHHLMFAVLFGHATSFLLLRLLCTIHYFLLLLRLSDVWAEFARVAVSLLWLLE